jgi:hypothetical protein
VRGGACATCNQWASTTQAGAPGRRASVTALTLAKVCVRACLCCKRCWPGRVGRIHAAIGSAIHGHLLNTATRYTERRSQCISSIACGTAAPSGGHKSRMRRWLRRQRRTHSARTLLGEAIALVLCLHIRLGEVAALQQTTCNGQQRPVVRCAGPSPSRSIPSSCTKAHTWPNPTSATCVRQAPVR